MLPDFIIIGAMKSATSTLHEQLALQPGIFMSKLKEPNFFSDDSQWAKGAEWYESQFSEAAPGDLIGESSTHYTKLPTYPRTVERMQSMLPDVKIIYLIRNPIDRLISHYKHGISEGEITGRLSQAVDDYPELISYGLYKTQIDPFSRAFGPDKILLLYFDDLRQNPQGILDCVCNFIGYKARPVWDHSLGRVNASSERLPWRPLRDKMLADPVVTFIRRNFVPKSIRNFVRRALSVDGKVHMSEDLRARLVGEFKRDGLSREFFEDGSGD